MDSLFGDRSWISPPAVASSDGPNALTSSPSTSCHSLSQSPSMDNFEYQNISASKLKKKRVEMILDSFISDLKSNKDQIKEEKRKEQLEKEERKEQRWESNRKEKKQMHKETLEIQKFLVYLLGKLVEKGNEKI